MDGQVAKSADMNAAVSLTTALAMFAFCGATLMEGLMDTLRFYFEHLTPKAMTDTGFLSTMVHVTQRGLMLTMPVVLPILLAGIGINLAQIGPLLTTKPLKPRFEKLNPIPGFKKFFSWNSTIEALKALIKMAVVALPAVLIIQWRQQQIFTLGQGSVLAAWAILSDIMFWIAAWSCAFFMVLGAFDWWFQRFQHEKRLRMSKQDIQDERKNQDGDPTTKGKQRRFGRQLLEKQMMAAIPKADVLINNPTHITVAIRYDPDTCPAPKVVAKGVDHLAMRMRELAKEHRVPMVENRPLARALFAQVEVDHMIPPDLFVAVAEVLAYVYSKNKGRKR